MATSSSPWPRRLAQLKRLIAVTACACLVACPLALYPALPAWAPHAAAHLALADGLARGGHGRSVVSDPWGTRFRLDRAPSGEPLAARSCGPNRVNDQGMNDDVKFPNAARGQPLYSYSVSACGCPLCALEWHEALIDGFRQSWLPVYLLLGGLCGGVALTPRRQSRRGESVFCLIVGVIFGLGLGTVLCSGFTSGTAVLPLALRPLLQHRQNAVMHGWAICLVFSTVMAFSARRVRHTCVASPESRGRDPSRGRDQCRA